MTPAAVHHGRAKTLHADRACALDAACAAAPERFVHHPPRPPARAELLHVADLVVRLGDHDRHVTNVQLPGSRRRTFCVKKSTWLSARRSRSSSESRASPGTTIGNFSANPMASFFGEKAL